ncbi:YPC1-Alkaline Ceramidase [Fusarium albosuccineum]|uniref:YPC1-Alkaline Ceramidase n=1 Tax=Fusarium albosuccineum TaxID=1237068 RepID=A0A8H4LND8_9HYPO|nr:YPC1-Alkaline Ceramidase [Fusarium albosuccineum]
MVMDEFLLHASTFGLGVWIIASRILRIIPQQVPDPVIRQKVRNISIRGCLFFAVGYIAWLIDELACRYLIDARRTLGLPLAFLLELHGWWHVLTAIGGYSAVAVVDLITSEEVHEDPTHLFAWPIPLAAGLTAGSKDVVKKN